ncbi:dethiobiotin synthase [Candidatus Mesenet endosymbiont of Agriotes lineatus]|uniref:dethiobiotin synthase n=1 Tax=Candidatus Mesenet endosymbiont of Agriotes lineatus TaxID=3077948 RepID=UPI0030CFCAD9
MQIFITGTDTNVGKTLISSWICLHTGYSYFKPIQTGVDKDSDVVSKLANTNIYEESYIYKSPLSPHLAASLENGSIDISRINLPKERNLIVEGAGGILVPIDQTTFMVDLIKKLNIPVILVARSTLGTINHTLLSLEALRTRSISILGVILNGPHNQDNLNAVEFYGKVQVLASVPKLQEVSKKSLMQLPLPDCLKSTI